MVYTSRGMWRLLITQAFPGERVAPSWSYQKGNCRTPSSQNDLSKTEFACQSTRRTSFRSAFTALIQPVKQSRAPVCGSYYQQEKSTFPVANFRMHQMPTTSQSTKPTPSHSRPLIEQTIVFCNRTRVRVRGRNFCHFSVCTVHSQPRRRASMQIALSGRNPSALSTYASLTRLLVGAKT